MVAGVEADSVLVRNAAGAHAAVAHLIGLGHRRVGVVSDPPEITSSAERIAGYRRALRAAGIEADPSLVSIGGPTQADGEAAALRLLDRPDRPTAVFTANNFMTVGALRAARALGLRIPSDVALVGFDDLDWTTLVQPPVTVVSQPVTELGPHRRPAAAAAPGRRSRPAAPDPARGAPDRARIVRGEGVSTRELLAELVSADSTNPGLEPGGAGEAAVAAIIAARMAAVGLEVDVWDAAPGRPNVVGHAARHRRRPVAHVLRPHRRRRRGPRGLPPDRPRRPHARPRHLRHEGGHRRGDRRRRAPGRRTGRRATCCWPG